MLALHLVIQITFLLINAYLPIFFTKYDLMEARTILAACYVSFHSFHRCKQGKLYSKLSLMKFDLRFMLLVNRASYDI